MALRTWNATGFGLKIVALLAAALVLPLLSAAAYPSELVIRGVTLVDVVNGTLLPGRTILIVGDRIKAIGTAGQPIRIPRTARLIDARGKYVIPGLIDAHVHLAFPAIYAHVTADEILPLFLANGITSVRDTGDDIMAEKLVARYAARHPQLSPHVFLCSPLIDGDPPMHRDIVVPLVDPAKVPAFVDDMAAWGVVTLKIYVGTGRAVGRRVIEEGHRHGMMVTGHLSTYTPLEAAEDGIDVLEHITYGSIYGFLSSRMTPSGAEVDLHSPVVQQFIATLAKRKVMVDPTLVTFAALDFMDTPEVYKNPDQLHMPRRWQRFCDDARTHANFKPETLGPRKARFRDYQELTSLLYRAGVPILAGTDTPEPYCVPGFSLQQELALLVESGLSPAAALQAATINNARSVKQDKEIGSIEEGKMADLVILNANPLADIKNTRKIDRVIKGGLVCDPRSLLKAVPLE